jgi:hypothetical protein
VPPPPRQWKKIVPPCTAIHRPLQFPVNPLSRLLVIAETAGTSNPMNANRFLNIKRRGIDVITTNEDLVRTKIPLPRNPAFMARVFDRFPVTYSP